MSFIHLLNIQHNSIAKVDILSMQDFIYHYKDIFRVTYVYVSVSRNRLTSLKVSENVSAVFWVTCEFLYTHKT